MTTKQQLSTQNAVSLVSVLVALVVFVNSLTSVLSKFDFRTVLVGFIVLIAITLINLLRLIMKKGNRFIICVVIFLCAAAAVVIGYQLFVAV